MNAFLERGSPTLGGPKPSAWKGTRAATSRDGKGSPAALPSGGGLPVFEKRVQLKDSLPVAARGSPMKQAPVEAPPSPEPRRKLKGATPLPGSPEQRSAARSGMRAAFVPTGGEADGEGRGEEGSASYPDGSPPGPSGRSGRAGFSGRSEMSQLATSQRTSSPSGRMHPNPARRAELRKADMFHNIDYYGGIGAPDNDRLVKEASWLSTQSWFESLRYYPKGPDADDDEAAYSGLTHGMAAPTEHLETDVRTRLGIAVADADWEPEQLQMQWQPEPKALLKRLRTVYQRLRA